MEIIEKANKQLVELTKDNKELINQIKQDHEQELNDINYAIDVNTGKVKDNDMFMFMSDYLNTSQPITKKGQELLRKLNLHYIENIKEFKASIKEFKSKKYTSLDTLNNDIYNFNNLYDTNYYNGFNVRIKDILDKDIQKDFIQKRASAIAHLQADSILKLGIDKFIKLDFKQISSIVPSLMDRYNPFPNNDFKVYIDLRDLISIQDYYKSNKIKQIDNDIMLQNSLKMLISNSLIEQVKKELEIHKDIYSEVHKLYRQVNKDIITIVNNFKLYRDNLTIGTSLQDISDKPIVRNYLKMPQIRRIDFDIMKLFNNIYPNYKYKSIDDDRHKDIDIKAELMIDLDLNNMDNLEDFRLVDFIKNGNIQLFPIQSALIEGFISIRDTNQATDKAIPLLSTLKLINEDKTMRLPTKKVDLDLYEDFMLFFNKCKIQIKIVNRKTSEVLFEILKPIPLLANTPAYKEGKYGYIIGNSVLNILKNELDEIYSKPKITTHQTSKKYLNAKLPHTPPITNMTQFIYPKIAQMINTYKTKKTYQGKVNITNLYDFQALYRKHTKPNIDDKRDTREMLNKVLDNYIKIGLIISYEPIKKGRDIEVYKIEINKNASI